jgi:hypothetical protein
MYTGILLKETAHVYFLNCAISHFSIFDSAWKTPSGGMWYFQLLNCISLLPVGKQLKK